jgi:hypothetical protein
VHSSEFKTIYVKSRYVRVLWREEWKDCYTVIYDYSRGGGQPVFYQSAFYSTFLLLKKKENKLNTQKAVIGGQRFPVNYEMTQFVLSYNERWDLL